MKTSEEVSRYFQITREPLFAFVVTSPLLLLYNLYYVFRTSGMHNGVDFLTSILFRYTGFTGFVLVNWALLLGSFFAGLHLKKQGKLSLRIWGTVTVEGLVYGLLLGKIVLSIMVHTHLLGADPESMSPVTSILLAAGAGYHEELIFRLIPLSLTLWLLPKLLPGQDVRQLFYLIIVVLIESFLFSIAHFMGYEEVSSTAFWYRFFAGILFSILMLSRGFASAAYAHFLYDVMVMLG